jgi:GT2 family glycosyltransferase
MNRYGGRDDMTPLTPTNRPGPAAATMSVFPATGDFDEAGYLAANPDVEAAVAAGVFHSGREHFEVFGEHEGRSWRPSIPAVPSYGSGEDFDEMRYLADHPDVQAAVAAGAFPSGREHFDAFGRREGRKPRPLSAAAPYKPRCVDPRLIAFPPAAEPRLSIIVPVHNRLATTLACLDALARHATEVAFEVLVADDASTDATSDVLADVENLVLVRQDTNVGFLRTCNNAVKRARGEYILLLNNDTEVRPGAIDALLGTVEADTTVGIVGAKLLYANGILQEAGCIVWSNGDACNYGGGDDRSDFRYNTMRDVDYCSGACLLVRRTLWEEIGGFDDRFVPAYYEDTDLCFAARAHGYRVVYQPLAEVVHYGGISHGTDTTVAGVKAHQTRNRRTFVQKWRRELQVHYPAGRAFLLAARDRRRTGHVVVIDHRIPAPDQDAGSVRLVFILETLIELGFVVHFVPGNMVRQEPYTRALQDRGIEVAYGLEDPVDYVVELGDVLSFVIVSRPDVGERFAPALGRRIPQVPLLYDMVDCHARREYLRAEVERQPSVRSLALRFELLEAALATQCDATIAVSEEDVAFLRQTAGPEVKTFILPTIYVRRPPPRPFAERSGLLFLGGYEHLPNVDAAVLLATDILPRVRAKLGEVRLTLAGSRPNEDVLALASDSVDVVGWVPELAPLFERARIFAAPLRFGAGLKGKIGESLSWGVPTVTSSIGAEGFGLVDGTHLLVADDPSTFAARIVSLYDDEAQWTALSVAGREFIETSFGTEVGRRRIAEILETVSIDVPSPMVRGRAPALQPTAGPSLGPSL